MGGYSIQESLHTKTTKVPTTLLVFVVVNLRKRTTKTYSPMDNDERKDRTQSTVSTIRCLRQGNINKLTQKTDKEDEDILLSKLLIVSCLFIRRLPLVSTFS